MWEGYGRHKYPYFMYEKICKGGVLDEQFAEYIEDLEDLA